MKTSKYSDIKEKEMNQQVLNQDILAFVNRCTYWEHFKGKRIVVTGSTGLIGSILVKCLIALEQQHSLGMTIYCVCRDKEKAGRLFDLTLPYVFAVTTGDFAKLELSLIGGNIDYVVHAAAPTASSYFKTMPIETYDGVVALTKFVLERAMDLKIKSMVYLSSLEVYGEILDDKEEVTEDVQGYINPLRARSSYSLGKRMAEFLCYAYYSEHHTPVKIARLAQTFGAGVSEDDNRVFAHIAKSAIKHEDVVLVTSGATKHNYCYTTDAIDAIFRVLLLGKDGEAYNVANEQTYISVRDMAELVLSNYSPNNHVIIENGDATRFPPVTKIRMSTKKIKALGWNPAYDLTTMFGRLIEWYK